LSVIRTVARGEKRYYYLVETYRWAGQVRRKEKYLGTTRPHDIRAVKDALGREVWEATWFPSFREIYHAYQQRLIGLPRSAAEKELEDFIVEFTYDTNRIEGSTLTYLETANLLTRGISPDSKPMRDIRETQAHAALLRRVLSDPEPIDLPHLLRWHEEIFGETKPDISGRIRDFEVRIRGSQHVPPSALEVRPMLVEVLRWFQRHGEKLNPVERAASFHFQFENIHPFGDGNGRIGRLAMNLMLFRDRYPMINIRYGNRTGYYRALERSSVSKSHRPFLLWFFRTYRRAQSWWFQPGKKGPYRRQTVWSTR
jgi:cell filamentation protein, protein adenylyltransferase